MHIVPKALAGFKNRFIHDVSDHGMDTVVHFVQPRKHQSARGRISHCLAPEWLFELSHFRVKEIATAATAYEVEANVDAPPTAADGGVTQIVVAALLPLKLVHLFADYQCL